ncbi:mitochondrial distribution and morphology protein-domain-containing protein [Boeremia exigua]|uniref:mitochondrial distribution and morphology protein-domain-containing protein n=1 Tax=Boeremia exigua TaxID=749465 RepID=UPI001E8CB5F7|nr:mitochondrial distribution and morphology protein-domain-containing protein [Boeremia exigua]KAH6629816.1 mitochondrial distribution and morphology protein-domain-containing protein [Boeremia exigua]
MSRHAAPSPAVLRRALPQLRQTVPRLDVCGTRRWAPSRTIASWTPAASVAAPLLKTPSAVHPSHVRPASVTVAARAAWRRHASSPADRSKSAETHTSPAGTPGSKGAETHTPPAADASHANTSGHTPPTTPTPTPAPTPDAKHDGLLDRLPHVPHLYRPSKAELLAAASGFWSRMKVRFKWLTIRSNRNFNADELYALFSWILAAHVAWVILGTTTFFMLTVFLINTAFSQETLAKWIGNYLTKSSGIKVVFETAVVPKWKDGVISFRKVFVSRRPGQGRGKVSKGSQTSAAAEAAIAAKDGVDVVEEDTNYTQFDVSMDTVNVTLSFSKWWNGKGLLKDVEIKGIRGVIDRTAVHTVEGVDPRSYKHEHDAGDFELDSFKMEDLLVTIHQPDGFRPFPVSIYSCELPQLRKQWLFYDFLSADLMSGSYDGSLFTVHPRQTHNYTGTQLRDGRDADADAASTWKKHSRIRIDALAIDHLNAGYDGPFSWIHEGNVDIVADIMLPADSSESLAKVIGAMYDSLEATVSANGRVIRHHFSDHAAHFADAHDEEPPEATEVPRFVIMDLRVSLNDVRAAVPIFTRDISYVNNALVRPIVAYINSKRTFIPVNCRVVKDVGEFDGSWTLYDSGLMEEVSREMYDAFARDVLDDRTVRKRRIKKVGIWTLQLAAQALFLGLAGNMA